MFEAVNTNQKRRLWRYNRSDSPEHGADSQKPMSGLRGEQLGGVDVDAAERHADAKLAHHRQ